MKVLFVGPYAFHPTLDKDTVYMIFDDFMDALSGAVGTVYLLTGRQNGPLNQELEQLYGFKIISPRAKGANSFSRIMYILEGIQAVRKHDIDVVTNTYGAISYGFDACVIARTTGRRPVVRVSGNEILTRLLIGRYLGIRGKFVRIIDRVRQYIAVNSADAVVAQSPWEVERLEKVVLRRTKRIHCCPRGVDLKAFHPMPTNVEARTERALTVLYVGRQSFEKGYDLVVESARALQSRKDIRFLIAGDFKARPESNVEYLGFVHPNNLEKLYEKADLILLPSRTEGFPHVLAIALAMGKPSIIPKHLFQNYVEDGKQALLCDLDVEDISEKIVYLHENPDYAHRMGQEAREFAARHLDRRELGPRYRRILLGKASDGQQ